MATRTPRVAFDGRLMAEDAAAKKLDAKKLALKTRLGLRTVYRFLSGEVQTQTTANALAKAIGQDVARYVIRTRREAMAS